MEVILSNDFKYGPDEAVEMKVPVEQEVPYSFQAKHEFVSQLGDVNNPIQMKMERPTFSEPAPPMMNQQEPTAQVDSQSKGYILSGGSPSKGKEMGYNLSGNA